MKNSIIKVILLLLTIARINYIKDVQKETERFGKEWQKEKKSK